MPAANPRASAASARAARSGRRAVLANAVADALAPLGVELNELPITPSRLWKCVQRQV